MTFHPKGVGKTKESFWGCSDYPKCKNTANPTQEEIKKYELQARIDAMDAEFTKWKEMAWLNATNNAVALTEHLPSSVWEDEEWQGLESSIQHWTTFFYEQHMEWWLKNIINEED